MTDKNAKNENSKLRIMTFFPPFIILVAFLVLSLVDQETFLGVINNINNWIIKNLHGSRRQLCHCYADYHLEKAGNTTGGKLEKQ